MAKRPIQVRIDETLKKSVEKVFERYGLDTSGAIRMFFKKVVLINGIPFDLRDDTHYHYTPAELKEIEEAYEESFDPQNLVGPFCSMKEALKELKKAA